jgi:hypothetical protein
MREALAQLGRDLVRLPHHGRQLGQGRGGDRHAEQGDGQEIELLSVGDSRDRDRADEAGEDLIDVGAHLHHPACTDRRQK